MNLCNPLSSLSFALLHAIEFGLDGVPSLEATALLGSTVEGPRRRRPMKAECEVVLFPQSMHAADLGWFPEYGDRVLQGEVVVVVGPQGDACVYFGHRLVHHLRYPNRRFFLDVAAQAIAGPGLAPRYEGRDDPVTESVDYAVQAELCQLRAALRNDPVSAMQVATLLQNLSRQFREVAAARCEGTPVASETLPC